jgi:dTDP-4-amino-4,6-dideoxygalactose transaminase
MDAVLTTMVSDSIGPGPESDRFASETAKYYGHAGGIAVRTPLEALRLALKALELPEGARLIVSPLAPGWYGEVLAELSFVPVYADVDPDNGCVSLDSIEHRLDTETKAILVHYPLGLVPDIAGIIGLGLPVVEDISQSLGAHNGEGLVGGFGRFTLVSTEAEGIITSGGGAVVTGKSKRDYGRLRSLSGETGDGIRLPDMNAVLGAIQLENIERHLSARSEIAKLYQDAIMKTKHRMLVQRGDAENVHFSFPVLLESGLKNVRQYASKKGVETLPAFEDTVFQRYPDPDSPCPQADALALRCLLFPLYPMLGKRNTENIIKILSTLP